MQLVPLRPASDLAALVRGYWLLDDHDRALAAEGLRCGPSAGGVICIQLRDLVATEFETGPLRACLTGIQDRARTYRPLGAARSFLILFTEVGAARLFPAIGPDVAEISIDLGAVVGDGALTGLAHAAEAAATGATAEIDAWLRHRLGRTAGAPELSRLGAAAARLADGSTVSEAAAAVSLSTRQVERLFRRHVGVGPKRFQAVRRLEASVHATLSGVGDPVEGFADQAHQIRAWRQGMDLTPGAVRRRGPSMAASRYLAHPEGREGHALYL